MTTLVRQRDLAPSSQLQADPNREATLVADTPWPAIPYAVAAGEPPKEASFRFTPGAAVCTLRRRWYLALPLAIVAAVAAGLAADRFVSANYTVRTQVNLATQKPVILYDTPDGRVDLPTYQRRQTQLARSRPVLRAALEQPGIAQLALVRDLGDPVAWLESELKIDFSGAPETMRITLSGANPDDLIALLDAIRETYLRDGVNKEYTDKQVSLERLRQVVIDEQAKMTSLRDEMTKRAGDFTAADEYSLRLRHHGDLARLANLQALSFQIDVQVKTWEQSLIDLIRRAANTPAPEISPADVLAGEKEALAKDTEFQTATAEVARLNSELIDIMKIAVDPASPKVVEKKRELERARQQLASREKTVREFAAQQHSADARRKAEARDAEHRVKVDELQAQIERGKVQITAIELEIDKLKKSTLAEAKGINDLDRMAASMVDIEGRIKTAKSRIEMLEVELKAPPRQTLEEAVIAQVPNPGKKRQMMAGAVVVGFLGALLGIAYLDVRAGRIDTSNYVNRQLGTDVVGYIPRASPASLAAIARSPYQIPSPDEQTVLDAVDACRTMLLDQSDVPGSKVIMVTSAVPGEGKTTLAAQLALSLARAGYRTLLIDGDVRQPGVHMAFGRPAGPGLVDALRQLQAAPHVIHSGPHPNLQIVPAGESHPQEVVALLQHRLGHLLEQWRPKYEVILIDTPPLFTVPDAMVIGRHADGTILSLMNDVSTISSRKQPARGCEC